MISLTVGGDYSTRGTTNTIYVILVLQGKEKSIIIQALTQYAPLVELSASQKVDYLASLKVDQLVVSLVLTRVFSCTD